MDIEQRDKSRLIFELGLNKKKKNEPDLISYGGRLWVYFRKILSLLAVKFRPTLKFDPDVISGRPPMTVLVGVYFTHNQESEYDYAGFGQELVEIYGFFIKAIQTDVFQTKNLTVYIDSMLVRRHVALLTATEQLEIDDYGKKIINLVKKYRERVEVNIKFIPPKNNSQKSVDVDDNDQDKATGNEGGSSEGIQPLLPNLEDEYNKKRPIKIKYLDEIYTGKLMSLALMSGIDSEFLIDGKTVKYKIEELNRLQIIENLKSYMYKDLTIKVKNDMSGSKKYAYVYKKDCED